jgi:hypothetical protein
MKFMATWQVHEDKRHETLKAFSQMTPADDKADMGNKVKLIGRWHDVAGFTGVAIFETDDPEAIPAWLLNWNHSIDIEVTPVLDDEETRAVGKSRFGS